MRIVYNDIGYHELIVLDNCEFGDFYDYAEKIKAQLNINYKNKLEDFDDLYWDFEFEKSEFVLCYNVYLGISICPSKFKNASEDDNRKLAELLDILIRKP